MRPNKIYLIVVLIIFLGLGTIPAQENYSLNYSKHRIGCIVGFGTQEIGLNVNYYYAVKYFQAQYYYTFLSKQTWELDLIVQPQWNLTKFRPDNSTSEVLRGFEYGVNAGILIRKNICNNLLSLYTFISAGPHYISGSPQRQSKGFIFSDNFFAGVNIKVYRNTYFDLRLGFRHVSNANLKEPNGGINNVVISGGCLINLQKKKQDRN